MDHVQKSISNEQMVNSAYEPDRCEIQDNGNLKCYIGDEILKTSKGQEELEIQMKGNKPKGGTITFNLTTNKTTYAGVVLEEMEYTLKDDGTVESKEYVPPLPATGDDYRGYYADVDGNGTVDGIIYADLARSQSGMWKDSYGSYSYSVQTNLNEYVVSNEIHNANDGFGENKIIKLKKKNGKERFYVMALEDFTEGSLIGNDAGKYYWYYNAYGNMSPQITETGFGTGKENTRKMIEKWNAAGTSAGYPNSPKNDQDIWKNVQEKYNEGWYIPSSGEWAAFGDYFSRIVEKDKRLTTTNYSNYRLSPWYWSSSQGDAYGAWFSGIDYLGILGGDSDRGRYLRLSITF